MSTQDQHLRKPEGTLMVLQLAGRTGQMLSTFTFTSLTSLPQLLTGTKKWKVQLLDLHENMLLQCLHILDLCLHATDRNVT